MPNYGEVNFTVQTMKVAAYNSLAGTWGTPVSVTYVQNIEISVAADGDMLKAQGQGWELLAVATHIEGKFGQGLIDLAAWQIMVGGAASESGVDPNLVKSYGFTVGSSGLPYFGFIAQVMSTDGADLHIGCGKAMLDAPPTLKFEQNKFVLPETDFKAVARSLAGTACQLKLHQTAEAITGTFADFFA